MNIFERFVSKKRAHQKELTEARRQELFLKVRDAIATQLEIKDDNKITPATKLTEDLNIDSLDTIELVMALEQELNIEIPDEDAEKLLTVQDVVDYLEKVLPNKAK